MKYIKFKRMGAKNFKLHVDPIDIIIPEKGIILISGPNGSGKTSVTEILPFTFFGRTPKKLTSNDVVNNKIGKDCVTFVDYDIYEEDGTVDKYRCTRYCKYKSIGNSVVLSKNNNKQYKVGHKEVLKEINKLWTNDVFMNTLYFAQKVKDFFMDIQDSDQKQIFKSILKTHEYETYKDIASKKEKENTEKINNLENDIKVNEKLLEETKQQLNRLENNKQEFYKEKENRIKQLNDDINSINNNINNLKEEINKININQLNEDLKFLNKYKNDIEYKLSNVEESKKKELDDLNTQLKYKKQEIESKFTNNKNELINNSNDLIEEKRSETEELISKLQDEINKLSDKYNDLNNELNKYIEELLQKNENEIEPINTEINRINDEYNNLKVKENELQTNIKNVDENKDFLFKDTSDIMEDKLTKCPLCKSEINEHTKDQIKNELDKLNEKKNNYLNEIEEVRKDLQSKINNKKELEKQIETLKSKFNFKKQELKDKYNKELNKINETKNEKENLINSFKNNFESFKRDTKENNSKEIEELKNKLNSTLSKLNEINKQKINEIEDKYKNEENELNNNLKEKETQIIKIEEKINRYNQLYEEINKVNNQLIMKQESLKEKEIEEFDNNEIEYYENKLKEYNNAMNENNSELTIYKNKQEAIEFWKKGFSNSGIPSMLIDEAIPFMNRVIKSYLYDMAHGRYSVTFDTLKQNKSGDFKDKISVNIFDNVTNANQREQLSGGQTRLIDIATILTLSDLQSYIQNVKTNLFVFEEIFDSLDNENISLVSKSLRKISENKVMFIISHTQIDQLEVDDNLQFYN